MKHLLTLFLSILLTGAIGGQIALAAPESLAVSVDVVFDEQYQAEVTYMIEGNNSDSQSEVTIPVVGREVNELSATVNTDKTGVTTDLVEAEGIRDAGYTNVVVSLPSSVQESGADWNMEIVYQTSDLYADFVKAQTIAVPDLELPGENVSEAWRLHLPLDSGLPIAFGLDPTDSVVSGGVQTYEYVFEGERDDAILLNFGTTATHELIQTVTLKNRGFWWNDFLVIIPPDTNQQSVAFEEITPKPRSIRLDRDGNILAYYRVSPLKTVEVKAKSLITVRSLNYNTDTTRPLSDIPDSFAEYTATNGVFSGGQEFTAEDSFALVERIYNDAREQQHSALDLASNLRASGVPSRLVEGQLLHNGAQRLSEPTPHTWVEAYVPGSGWLTLDPAVGVHYDQLGLTDAYRIAEAVNATTDSDRSDNRIVAVSQTDRHLPEEPAKPQIEQTKFLILPGLSFTRTSVIMPSGMARDGLGYSVGEQTSRLGSLAPLQTVSLWNIDLGAASWGNPPIVVGQFDGQELQPIDEATASVNIIPLVVLVVGLAAASVIVSRIRRHRNKPIVIGNSDEDDGTPAEELLQKRQQDDDHDE